MYFAYIDDSSITIDEVEHIILAAIITDTPELVYQSVHNIREKNNIIRFDEFKTPQALVNNQNDFLEDVTQAILRSTKTVLCSISSSNSKDKCLRLLLRQVIAYANEQNIKSMTLFFDNGIYNTHFLSYILSNDTSCLIKGFNKLDSKYDYGIQLSDWFVTNFKTNLAFGMRSKDKSILVQDIDGNTEMSYRFFSNISIRYHWWGEVLNADETDDFSNGRSPYKFIVNKGIYIDSTDSVINLIKNLTTTYMGCLH